MKHAKFKLKLVALLLLSACNNKELNSQTEESKNSKVSSFEHTKAEAEQAPGDKGDSLKAPSRADSVTTLNESVYSEEFSQAERDTITDNIVAKAKKLDTYNEIIPSLEKALNAYKDDTIVSVNLECELAGFYLLKYFMEYDKAYYTKAYDTFSKALETDKELKIIPAHNKISINQMKQFKQEWAQATTEKDIEALMINALMYGFKRDVREQNQ